MTAGLYRILLRRPFFKGQDRIFNFLFSRNKLNNGPLIVKPLNGNFLIKCDTSTWIGAKIVYTGEYESELKKVFRQYILPGYTVLDIGANIGFHTLYFAELTGEAGQVIAFEPVPINFIALNENIKLNKFTHIITKNIALGNKNEQLKIAADNLSKNPGAFNLFDQSGDTLIDCYIGDEIINHKVDFIKIDVEGYESFVIQGLLNTIEANKPKIVFEYDRNYHQKTGLPIDFIFTTLKKMGYTFFLIGKKGPQIPGSIESLKSGNILALPNA